MYYKYSDNDIKENGIPYKGIFRVDNGLFLKGSDGSEILDSDHTFMRSFYLKLDSFDNNFMEIDQVEEFKTLPFDIVNKQYLDRLFGLLDDNNIKIYKSLTTINPTIFDKINVKFYSLSSPESDMMLFDKETHSEMLSGREDWGFMERIVAGVLLPTSENTFKYLTSTGTEIYSLSGSFDDGLLSITNKIDLDFTIEIQNIHYDEVEERLSIIQGDEILIYDGLLYKNCDNLVLIDSIKLKDVDTEIFKWTSRKKFIETFGRFNQKYLNGNPNNPEFIKFGNKYRTSIDNGFLFILDKYSSEILRSINLDDYKIDDLITSDIRTFDDKIAILHRKYNSGDGIFISFIDLGDKITVKTDELQLLDTFSERYRMEFCGFDSDLIFISNKNQYQIRSINKPKNPLGSVDHSLMKYLPRFKFGNTRRKHVNAGFKWGSNNMNSNNQNYIISNSVIVSENSFHGILSSGRLYVIRQRIKDFYKYKIDKGIEKSFDKVECSKSSYGLFINDHVHRIIKDIVSLQSMSFSKWVYGPDQVSNTEIKDLLLRTENLYLALNEKIHALNFQRIVNEILDTQRGMISISKTLT
jgi:hypothetical protein